MLISESKRDVFFTPLGLGILGIDHGSIDVFLMPIVGIDAG